jgi:molybdopterin converting factor small subunit
MQRIKFEVPAFVKHLTSGAEIVSVEGHTVGECLSGFIKKFPCAKKLLIDAHGQLLGHIEICVNGASVFPEELKKEVKEGDTISMVYLIAGG